MKKTNKLLVALCALIMGAQCCFAQLPYNTELNETLFNDGKVIVGQNYASWNNGIVFGGGAFNWDDKYVIIALDPTSIPNRLAFTYKVSTSFATNPNWYVAESSDNNEWSTIWSAESKNTSWSDEQQIALSKSTKFVKLCYSGNFQGTFAGISVSDQAYVNDPKSGEKVITELDFGTGTISSGKAELTFEVEWCNVNTLSVTSDNTDYFTVSPASFGGKAQYGSQLITVTYNRDKAVGEHSGIITVANDERTITLPVAGVTTKREQAIHWNSELVATHFTLNAGDVLTKEAVATSDNEEAVITFASDSANVIAVSPDGMTLNAVENGETRITVTASGNEIYNEAVASQVFTVTSNKKQTITWTQNLMGLKTDASPATIQLDATATSGGLITYAIEGDAADCITLSGDNNAMLTITGVPGEAYIIATQAGGLIGDEEWISVSVRKQVKVRDPNSECDEYALADESFSFGKGDKTTMAVQEYALVGKPTQLTFSAKCGSLKYIWSEREPIYVEQYANYGSGLEWKQVVSTKLETKEQTYGPYELDETATKIRFRSGEYAEQNVSNITVPRKKELLLSEDSIVEEAERNVRWTKQIAVSRSNIDVVDILVESTDSVCPFELSRTSIGTDCADRTTETFEVSFTPRERNTTYEGTITVTDGKANPTTRTIALRISTVAFNQSILDFELPEEAEMTDTVTFHATATSGLEVIYLSSDSAIAYVENNSLVILAPGTVDITAYQAGNDRYNPASETKTIRIRAGKVAQTIQWTEMLLPVLVGDSVTLGAKASSGLDIVYISSDSTIAYVEGATLYALAVGEVTITATQPGEEEAFEPAEPVARVITVIDSELQEPIIFADPEAGNSIEYGQPLADVELVNGMASVPGEFVWADSALVLEIGTHWMSALFVPEDVMTYKSVRIENIEVVVTKASQTIEWLSAADTLLVRDTMVVEVIASSGLEVTLESATPDIILIEGITLYALAEGEVVITAKQAGDDHYLAAEATKTIVVHSEETGIENVQGNDVQCTKVLENGVLYLKYKGTTYDVQGHVIR